jgi:hypothetical protein
MSLPPVIIMASPSCLTSSSGLLLLLLLLQAMQVIWCRMTRGDPSVPLLDRQGRRTLTKLELESVENGRTSSDESRTEAGTHRDIATLRLLRGRSMESSSPFDDE